MWWGGARGRAFPPRGVGLVVTSDQSELEWGEEEDQGSGDSGEGVRYGCSLEGSGWPGGWCPGVVPSELAAA